LMLNIIFCSIIFSEEIKLNPYNKDIVSLKYWVSKDCTIKGTVTKKSADNTINIVKVLKSSEDIHPLNRDAAFPHEVSWDGYIDGKPAAEGEYTINLSATAKDNPKQILSLPKSVIVKYEQIVTSDAKLDFGNVQELNLDPSNPEKKEKVISAKGGYFWRTKAIGKYYEPLKIKYKVKLNDAKQRVKTYPYVPFVTVAHRWFDELHCLIEIEYTGKRVYWQQNSWSIWEAKFQDFKKVIRIPYVFTLVENAGKVADDKNIWFLFEKLSTTEKAKFNEKYKEESIEFTGNNELKVGYDIPGHAGYRGSKFGAWQRATPEYADELIKVRILTKDGKCMDEWQIPFSFKDVKNIPLDEKLTWGEPTKYAGIVLNNEKGKSSKESNFDLALSFCKKEEGEEQKALMVNSYLKVGFKMTRDAFNRMTNRYYPWYGYVNKNYSREVDFGLNFADAYELGFPNGSYFEESLYGTDNTFPEIKADEVAAVKSAGSNCQTTAMSEQNNAADGLFEKIASSNIVKETEKTVGIQDVTNPDSYLQKEHFKMEFINFSSGSNDYFEIRHIAEKGQEGAIAVETDVTDYNEIRNNNLKYSVTSKIEVKKRLSIDKKADSELVLGINNAGKAKFDEFNNTNKIINSINMNAVSDEEELDDKYIEKGQPIEIDKGSIKDIAAEYEFDHKLDKAAADGKTALETGETIEFKDGYYCLKKVAFESEIQKILNLTEEKVVSYNVSILDDSIEVNEISLKGIEKNQEKRYDANLVTLRFGAGADKESYSVDTKAADNDTLNIKINKTNWGKPWTSEKDLNLDNGILTGEVDEFIPKEFRTTGGDINKDTDPAQKFSEAYLAEAKKKNNNADTTDTNLFWLEQGGIKANPNLEGISWQHPSKESEKIEILNGDLKNHKNIEVKDVRSYANNENDFFTVNLINQIQNNTYVPIYFDADLIKDLESAELRFQKDGFLQNISLATPENRVEFPKLLGFWDITRLNGAYLVQFIYKLKNQDKRVTEETVCIGTPVEETSNSKKVNSPYGRVSVSFGSNPFKTADSPNPGTKLVTVTPVSLGDVKITNLKYIADLGGIPIVELLPETPAFNSTPNLVYRYTKDEVAKIDAEYGKGAAANYHLYGISSSGKLEQLVTICTPADDVLELSADLSHFSTYVALGGLVPKELGLYTNYPKANKETIDLYIYREDGLLKDAMLEFYNNPTNKNFLDLTDNEKNDIKIPEKKITLIPFEDPSLPSINYVIRDFPLKYEKNYLSVQYKIGKVATSNIINSPFVNVMIEIDKIAPTISSLLFNETSQTQGWFSPDGNDSQDLLKIRLKLSETGIVNGTLINNQGEKVAFLTKDVKNVDTNKGPP
ncbi:MAG: hypothetical protein WC860_09485, partial [Candidatus Margulisiibacteriota bacterium]